MGLLSKLKTIPPHIIKYGLYIFIALFLANSVFGKFPDIIGNFLPFITRSEYRETLKKYNSTLEIIQKNQVKIDSMMSVINDRDNLIKKLESEKTVLQNTRLKNKRDIKNAKGNVTLLDSIANSIF